ncbi:meiotically up-regulated gene 113-domain-containing protein [Parachaetomium inaequale]|uniref:Meiotically up-regulated gene 113-domain-containing protein n=1 Tax=Parachaetomium inaequale TaxID=2588326 RepID=A0AAN6ST85_9PEZI|nr:meiotically up-regulated gene 113-domain-containing protein [Parachaetomium inaequale]
MPFYANTPESRLGRADSKNPSTTCRGLTSTGRPCRRSLAADDAPPPSSRLKPSNIRTDDPADESLYCWQHKDQASASAKSSPGPRMSHTPILEERSSLDTLAERLGLARTQSEKPPKGSGRPGGSGKQRPTKTARPKPKETTFCFCFRIPVGDVDPPPRPRPQPVQPASVSTPPRPSGKKSAKHSPSPSRPRPGSSAPSPGRKSRRGSEASQTAQFMSVIPQDAPPQTASQLLAELAKPVSPQDEAGYIYIFWLTPESEPSTPPAEAARSLLAPPSTPNNRARRPSDVLSSFARLTTTDEDEDEDTPQDDNKKKKKKTILLKIGRATNVQRRLNEWQRQCGYNLSLIRYYPYVSSSSSPSPSPSPGASPGSADVARKVPHSHKVERLVHIELRGRGLGVADREKCEACGREHREWFEVEASRAAVAGVDEIVRRWSDWDEGLV